LARTEKTSGEPQRKNKVCPFQGKKEEKCFRGTWKKPGGVQREGAEKPNRRKEGTGKVLQKGKLLKKKRVGEKKGRIEKKLGERERAKRQPGKKITSTGGKETPLNSKKQKKKNNLKKTKRKHIRKEQKEKKKKRNQKGLRALMGRILPGGGVASRAPSSKDLA